MLCDGKNLESFVRNNGKIKRIYRLIFSHFVTSQHQSIQNLKIFFTEGLPHHQLKLKDMPGWRMCICMAAPFQIFGGGGT